MKFKIIGPEVQRRALLRRVLEMDSDQVAFRTEQHVPFPGGRRGFRSDLLGETTEYGAQKQKRENESAHTEFS
jgi:hypothetical protein